MAGLYRKVCLSLQDLCQIEVVKLLHCRAANLEAEYIDGWCRQLTDVDQSYERKLDIRSEDIDTAKVVHDFLEGPISTQVKVENSKRRKKIEAEPKKKIKTSRGNKVDKQTQAGVTRGIPDGVPSKDYILYRKCKFIEDIRAVRNYLSSTLNAAVINDLMGMVYNMSLYNSKKEYGLMTLQAILSTNLLTEFRLASAKLYLNFSAGHNFETTIGTTILHHTLVESSKLVHLSLEKCCCDSLLKLLAQVSRNLKYLKISGSFVSDKGLLYLCGVEKKAAATRVRLNRSCKELRWDIEHSVGTVPRFEPVDENFGCLKLEHIEAYNLQCIDWPQLNRIIPFRSYKDATSVPWDSGFVAALTFLPELRTLLTEVGCRSVLAFIRMRRKSRKLNTSLPLKVVGEMHITPSLVASVLSVCKNLKEIRVQGQEPFVHNLNPQNDEWVEQLSGSQLNSLRTRLLDFKSPKLSTALQKLGPQLTVIELKDLSVFRHSNFRAIKLFCPNLCSLTMTMRTTNLFTTSSFIEVDKDANLEFLPDIKFPLAKLDKFHLSGPFGNYLAKYLLRDAKNVSSLALGIEWLEPTFSSANPESRSDYLGKEYLEEILSVNDLSKLEELHLYAQFQRGRNRLTKDCAEFILSTFPALKHLGNFSYWNMRRTEKLEIITKSRSCNRGLIFEEDLHYSGLNNHEQSSFEYCFIPERLNFACNNISLRRDSLSHFSILEVFAGPPQLLGGMESDDSSDEEEEWSDDDDDLGNDFLLNVDPEPVCVIM